MSSTITETVLDSSRYRPPPPPDHHDTVIVVVIVSCGGLLLAFMAAALLCFLKKRRKKRTREEMDILHADKHKKVKEEIVKGPHGMEAVVVTVEDDVHVDARIIKNNGIEKLGDGSEGTLATEPGQPSSEQRQTPPPPPPSRLA